ncbi:class 1b ribonucleoside-diphosphate reductase subunit beta [Paenibacillus chitinolyticus]|uniref:Ribonucleoside-diphosphate reductase subunit beta n=1 Tax=Paenibacillus chitinolyticus TaxID=79263 RepID=A0A410WXG3_9BACL|nr:class 1b ribonucleoside-diphosphate reductase subunit beta [Paenibacillus chitinolyticus]MCY9592329.1 class 1b ribonucleoside-diphosphate reductase subunit beta [Paenibacillus chitinolyticus]MCY9599791.1 class 1b ribonucleoside-diphosphate reductase subunit beta [Paenibacillus chitinolyticus]QAV18931.1 class 1b ribonucleoside-diphosphate reductase subunit beta [Paenibacillus chitinolyticus]
MIKPVNWNEQTSDYANIFWEQNTKQFWLDTEIPVSKDKKVWESLTNTEQEVYMKVLAGLTLLDTEQGGVGMPKVLQHVDDLQEKAVLAFMAAMEQVHAKSYSTIFTTLATKKQIDDAFKWAEENKWLQAKAMKIDSIYEDIKDDYTLAKALIASVFLESFLFYSGFYYPLYLAGQGKLKNSGEIIFLITRDEAIHGVFVGLLFQKIKSKLTKTDKKRIDESIHVLLNELYEIECRYSEDIYDDIGIASEVKKFVRHNANKALMNLGYEPYFPAEEIDQIVLNGLSSGGTFDFFSLKGGSYVKAKVEPIRNGDFEYLNELMKGYYK